MFGSVILIHTQGGSEPETQNTFQSKKDITLSARQTGGYGNVDGIYTTGNSNGKAITEITSIDGNINLIVVGSDSNYKASNSAFMVTAITNSVTYLEGQQISTTLTTEGLGDIILSAIADDTYFAYGVNNNYGDVSLIGNKDKVNPVNDDLSLIKVSATSEHNQATAVYQGVYGNKTFISGDSVELIANAKGSNATSYALLTQGKLTDIDSQGNILLQSNSLTGKAYAIYAYNNTTDVRLESKDSTFIIANSNTAQTENLVKGFGSGLAIYSTNSSFISLLSKNNNTVEGGVAVLGSPDINDDTEVLFQAEENRVSSYATIVNAGDLNTDAAFKDSVVISALYAEGDNAHIKLTGRNQILTHADSENDKQLERTVWAYDGASIELDGWTLISTDRYDTSPQSLDVAIAAGTAVNLTDSIVSNAEDPSSSVAISYENDGAKLSHIEGDVLAAYDGSVKVQPKDASSDGLSVKGNLLAGNKGELSLNLGKGGELIGRADSYMDADGTGNDAHTTFFDPAFSSTIYRGGTIDLNMGKGSTWIVTGQSWITNLSGNGTINLVNAFDGDDEDTSHALHVQNLSGKHTFVVNLNDSDHSVSDMLYINNVADGSNEQVISIDGFEGLENMAHLDRIRFATVNASNSDLYFVTEELNPDEPQTPEALARASRTQVRDVGFYDVGFRIESETRLTDTTVSEADDTYDGKEFNTDKPGKSYVDTVYGSNKEDAQNWYLVRDKSGDSTSDGGETILATARAAYWNAVEIDRLNKRLGDARHANGGTDGFWVRVRNDRIGTDAGVGDFRSRNYAYQFGYDHTKKEDDGKRLFGAALDYMDGNTTYRDIEGTGATDRFGVTAYMTWLGDDGWYYDVVGKWGVLSNSFRITSDYGVFVDGDYDNHVLGASFEFGRKLTKENSPWFLEPQAQIQHVMVTEASYSTNQGTHVDQDKINSTITRLGFRIGRNFGEKQSGVVYAKADWLKEWHGHQGIRVTDTTTGNTAADVSIDNKGNWFDVGFGVQSPITDTTYFFADAEYVFGNDLDNTWNFNAGVRWMFH